MLVLTKYIKFLNRAIFLGSFVFLTVINSYANENAINEKVSSSFSHLLDSLSEDSLDRGDYYKALFRFTLEGAKGDVLVNARDFEKEFSKKAQEENQGKNDSAKNDKEQNSTNVDEDVMSFSYALKTPYFYTENKELMLDVIDLAELYEPNLLVTLKENILTLIFSSTQKKILEKEEQKTDPVKSDALQSTDDKDLMQKVQFDKEVYTLVFDLDNSEEKGLLTHNVYQRTVEERDSTDVSREPIFIIDEIKSYKNKEVRLNTPIEIIENHVFVPLSTMIYFNEIVNKEADFYFASNKLATKENIKKLSQIKNITKEIEKAPEFLSRENFELIYAMIGPAGAAILVLVLVATYLALKNFYYLTFVWFQFTGKFKKLDNECQLLDEEIKTKNPMIHLLREINALNIKDPTTLRTEISFIFNRNFESVVQDLAYIRLISVISPLLGLLGTVLGMVDVFQAIAESSSPDPADLAQGIWSALLTTILGLSVAVPTLIVYYYLLLKYKRYQNRMIKFTNHFHSSCSGQ